jgi:hypothetical protein
MRKQTVEAKTAAWKNGRGATPPRVRVSRNTCSPIVWQQLGRVHTRNDDGVPSARRGLPDWRGRQMGWVDADKDAPGSNRCAPPSSLSFQSQPCLLRLPVCRCCCCAQQSAALVQSDLGPERFARRNSVTGRSGRSHSIQVPPRRRPVCLPLPSPALCLPSLPNCILTGPPSKATAATDATRRGPLRRQFVAVRALGDG